MDTSGSHAGASSGVFSFEARHHAKWASAGHHLELLFLITARGSLAAGRFFGRAALRRRQGLPAMTAAASCSARRCSPTPATRQHACCWLVLRARGSPPAPRAARDDCGGFVFGSAVLADAGDQATRMLLVGSSGARLSAGAKGWPR